MRSKQKKKIGAHLERMLLDPIPQTPIPQPYFSIPSPEPYRFPLSQTMLEGVKLLEHYEPDQINHKIRNKLPNQRIQKMSRYRNTYCMMGKNGNGLIIDEKFLDIRGATAFAYGPSYLIIAFEDLRLEVYNMQLKLIKAIKKFSLRKITFLKILSTPKNFESIIILACQGNKLYVHRLQKSLFSTLSCKLTKQVISSLEFPVTQITQIPTIFKYYLRKDGDYRDCSLVCVSAINKIYILKVNHFRLSMEDFIKIVHIRNHHDITINTVSWGQACIEAPSRFITGNKLILTYTFGNQVYFLALRQIQKFVGGEVVIKYQWAQSHPLLVDEGNVVFCQYMKKNQILIITDNNTVVIFHTKKFDIFQKQYRTKNIETFYEKFSGNLEAAMIGMIPAKKKPQTSMETRDQDSLTAQQRQMLAMTPLVTYANTFQYQYPSNQISFLTQKQFQVYLYCDWKIISNIMKVQQKYECAMLFLIAIYKKANKFDLGVADSSPQELSQFIQMLAIDYINNKLSNIKSVPQILKNILDKQEYFKMVVTPIQFLAQTQEFAFLFDIAKDKIITSLIDATNSQAAFDYAQSIFYAALMKFIQHGRIKFIPEEQLKITLKYFMDTQNLDMIDRLAIYFDLSKIDRNIVIQCLLNNNLVVSLAHVCTQGNQSQFVTPFVKFWGISENYRRLNNSQYAAMFAIRALWYVQLCLQRNWALKEYSFDKYAEMIRILSQHFLTQSIITGLLQIKTEYCLQTLAFYFTIENTQIICQQQKLQLKFPNIKIADWIMQKQGFQQIQLLLSALQRYLLNAVKYESQANKLFNLFLSSIIIYKTVKFNEDKYLQILISLIENYDIIKSMNYGLQQKKIQQFKDRYQTYDNQDIDLILSARYINKILTLVYYECNNFIKCNLQLLFSKATQFRLTDLQSQISFLQGNFRRCIDIYKTAKQPSNSLIFQFLENSFKRLILQKKKDDKKKLASGITKQIKWMVGLDPHKTITIIQNYIQQIQDNLIDALSDDSNLQLQFLQNIINNENLVQMKQKLKDQSINKYVQLLAKSNKQRLIDIFKANPRFASEDTLHTCEKYHVYDSMEYLYQRMGNITASVKIAAMRIDQLLRKRADELDQYEEAPYIKIKQILDNSIEVCRNNNSQQIWESLLDSFIALYQKYNQDPKFPEDQLQVFFYINGEIMENLASNCPIQHTIDLLQNKYKDMNMGGKMSYAFTNILSNLSHSINILYIATNLIQLSLHRELTKDFQSKIQCYSSASYCQNCNYGIIKRDKSIHFKCGHVYHKQCMITKDPVCVSCLAKQNDQFEYYLNTLNPQNPKIRKINELFQRYDLKKMEMQETFRIQEYERAQKKQEKIQKKQIKKKSDKLLKFDQDLNIMDVGNRRVLNGLRM